MYNLINNNTSKWQVGQLKKKVQWPPLEVFFDFSGQKTLRKMIIQSQCSSIANKTLSSRHTKHPLLNARWWWGWWVSFWYPNQHLLKDHITAWTEREREEKKRRKKNKKNYNPVYIQTKRWKKLHIIVCQKNRTLFLLKQFKKAKKKKRERNSTSQQYRQRPNCHSCDQNNIGEKTAHPNMDKKQNVIPVPIPKVKWVHQSREPPAHWQHPGERAKNEMMRRRQAVMKIMPTLPTLDDEKTRVMKIKHQYSIHLTFNAGF